jgi:hypothetical protein
MQKRTCALAIAILVASASAVHADARAEAILLFDQGIKEMKAGNFEKACKSFEDSNARYPDSGTKGSLARCYEKLGKLASSWLLWRTLADTAPTSALRKDAANQAAKLDKRVPKYVVKIFAPTPGLSVTVDGKPAGTSGLRVPIDAGPVAVVATAPGYQDWKTELTATEGATLTIQVPALVVAPKDDVIVKPPPPIVDTSGKRRKRRLIGATVTGVGVAAVVVGGIFGVSARGKFDDAKATCGGSIDSCFADRVAEAQSQVDDARSAANLSSIMFGVGGALVVTGAVIWFTAPAAEQRGVAIAPTADASSAGFVVSGRF